MLHEYDEIFYLYQREGSLRSARKVLPLIHSQISPRSILDVGCGAGAWLKIHNELGVDDFLGVDGDYVKASILLIDESNFHPWNITRPFELGRQFDLVQCLEVAEHIPAEFSETLVDNLTRHGKVILFSAAAPGQGGESHINEQPYDYWKNIFSERGYQLYDFIRPIINKSKEVESWYRYNILLFVHESMVNNLTEQVKASYVNQDSSVKDISPFIYKLRKLLFRLLPYNLLNKIAFYKHKCVLYKMKLFARK